MGPLSIFNAYGRFFFFSYRKRRRNKRGKGTGKNKGRGRKEKDSDHLQVLSICFKHGMLTHTLIRSHCVLFIYLFILWVTCDVFLIKFFFQSVTDFSQTLRFCTTYIGHTSTVRLKSFLICYIMWVFQGGELCCFIIENGNC